MSSRGDATSCPKCGQALTPIGHDVFYCRKCRYLNEPPNLWKEHGIIIMERHTDDHHVEPVLIKLSDPAIEKRMAQWVESRFTREIRSEETPADRPTPLTEGETAAAGTDGSRGERQAPESGRTRRRHRPGDAALKVRAALETLIKEGTWNGQESQIISVAKVAKSTYYHVINNDKAAKATRNLLERESGGKGPTRIGEA
jgi:hypothetical protein